MVMKKMSASNVPKLGFLLLVTMMLSAQLIEAATWFSVGVFIGVAVLGLIANFALRKGVDNKLGSVNIVNNFSKPIEVHCRYKDVDSFGHHYQHLQVGGKYGWAFRVSPSAVMICNFKWEDTPGRLASRSFKLLKPKGQSRCFPACHWSFQEQGKNITKEQTTMRISDPLESSNKANNEPMSILNWKRISDDPQSKSIAKWGYIMYLAGVSSLFLDFFFLFVPTVNNPNYIRMDWSLGAYIAMARSASDLFFLWGMVLKFQTSNTCSKSERKDIVNDPKYVSPKYTKSSLIVDLLAILPIPQAFVGHKILAAGGIPFSSTPGRIIFAQLPFRIIAMSPHSERTIKMAGILMKNAWLGALQNLLFFIMISNGVGAVYYDIYISKLLRCRTIVRRRATDAASLDWDELIARCTQDYKFEYGVFSDAFTTKIGTRSFTQKYIYCLSWGLKSLSSFGQTFSASSDATDTILSFFTVIFGLVLFGDLLARMQSGLQCTEVKEDRQRTRQRMVDEWMKYHQLPQHLKRQVKQAIQSEWSATKGINDEATLDSLPWDIRFEIRRHLYLDILRTMPVFAEMDNELVNAICGHLRTFSGNQATYIAFEGEPVRDMIFIYSGELEVSYANSGGHSVTLGPGELCGQELLEWCSFPTKSTENLPSWTQTVKCITDVDAFSLAADDVKLLAIQFHRDGKFRQAFQRYAA